ncbi:unnamed protein product, partial [Acanthocheilonema viteae]
MLTQKTETINPMPHQQAAGNFWQELNQGEEELDEQMENSNGEVVELREEEITESTADCKLIIIGICVFIILTLLIVIKFNMMKAHMP